MLLEYENVYDYPSLGPGEPRRRTPSAFHREPRRPKASGAAPSPQLQPCTASCFNTLRTLFQHLFQHVLAKLCQARAHSRVWQPVSRRRQRRQPGSGPVSTAVAGHREAWPSRMISLNSAVRGGGAAAAALGRGAAGQMGRRAVADGGRAVRSPGRRWRRARPGPDAQEEGRQHDDLAVGLRFLCWPRAQRRLLQLFEEMGVCTCVVRVLRRSCKKHSLPFFYLLSGRESIRCCHGRSLPFHRSGGLDANQLRHRSDVH
jgi:hypothetical protein